MPEAAPIDRSPASVVDDGSTGQPSVGGVWDGHRRRLTTGLVLTIVLVAFESLAIATVMPTVERDLGGLSLYGWVFSGFFLATLPGIVITGILTDRRGPAVPFAAGLVLFSVGLIAGGLASSMGMLVLARLAQGFGAGAIPASAYASVARGYPPSLRPRVFAVFSTAWVVPGLIGPTLATAIEHAASWRWVFLGLLPLVVLSAAMTLPALTRLPGPAATDPADDAASTSPARRLGLVLVLVGGVALAQLATTVAVGPAAVAMVLVGVPVAAAAFLRVVPPGTARLRPVLPAVVGVRGLLTASFFGADAFVTLAVTEGRGGSTALAGLALTAVALTWTAGAWTQERHVARIGPRRLDRLAFVLIGTATAAMVPVALALPAWTAVPVWAVAGMGMGLGYAPLSVSALGAASPGREGEATAALQLCDTLGVSLGTGIGGALVALADGRGASPSTGAALAFGMATVIAVGGTVAAGRLPVRIPGG